MPTTAPALPNVTAADRLATLNWDANLKALRATQPLTADLLSEVVTDWIWTFGRDGTLTARTRDAKWWAGCSVPVLAARALLETLDQSPLASCLLAPEHVGIVIAAREKVGRHAPLLVLCAELSTARVVLCGADFSSDLHARRLTIVAGPDWPAQMRQLFDDNPGLATPTRFIRTRLTTDETAEVLIPGAQQVFAAVLESRAKIVSAMTRSDMDYGRILLIGRSDFGLWDNAVGELGDQLAATVLSNRTIHRFDTLDPLCTSPVALAQASRSAGVIVSADLSRIDSNNLVPMEQPWITWLTRPNIPPFATAGPRDGVVLVDGSWRALATKAGWPVDRVAVCGWPETISPSETTADAPLLGMFCDTRRIEVPASIDEFSSHRVLWEMIETELLETPLTLDTPEKYLNDRATQLNIEPDSIERSAFVHLLIVPAYQQGLARLLLRAELPLQIRGAGWEHVEAVQSCYAGPILDREQFSKAVRSTTALVHCWPDVDRSTGGVAHPVGAVGKPVVRRVNQDVSLLVRTAKRMLATPASVKAKAGQDLRLGRTIVDLIERLKTAC